MRQTLVKDIVAIHSDQVRDFFPCGSPAVQHFIIFAEHYDRTWRCYCLLRIPLCFAPIYLHEPSIKIGDIFFGAGQLRYSCALECQHVADPMALSEKWIAW